MPTENGTFNNSTIGNPYCYIEDFFRKNDNGAFGKECKNLACDIARNSIDKNPWSRSNRWFHIDVINYTSNIQLYITRALSPAKVSSVKINEETKRAEVFLKVEEVSKAIGRGGHNIKLASILTGYELDVIREGIVEEEDVELREFSDEIEAWVIEEFEKIGLDTARSVLNQDVVDLVRRTDLEEETILEVVRILKDELDN